MSTTQSTMLVLNRDHTLVTLYGHVIEFKKDVPTHVPPIAYAKAIEIGAVRADGSKPNVLEDETKPTIPTEPAERKAMIAMAIESIVERNARNDFTAAGSPTADAVSAEIGFKVNSKEIAPVWQEYHEKKAAIK